MNKSLYCFTGACSLYDVCKLVPETQSLFICLCSKFSPSLRPFLQTVVISMVSFGENYKKQQTGLGKCRLRFDVFMSVIPIKLLWGNQSFTILTHYISISPMNFDLFTGIAALSFFTSGKYMVDPELRGTEFERITQNLDTQFWKTFWNLTETELLSVSISMLCASVRTDKTTPVPCCIVLVVKLQVCSDIYSTVQKFIVSKI